MEVNACVEDGMDTKFASSRCKAKKAVLNRRPSGYWKVFSNWWRGRYAALKTRPTVHEVIEWYHRNAASSWPAGQVPCLKAVLRQSKGLRPIDGLKEYFREYRKKRKQQGGLALKACDDGTSQRARPAKRRRGRAAQRDSSDEDEAEDLENDASGLSDQAASDDEEGDAEDGTTACEPQDEPITSAAEAAATATPAAVQSQQSDKPQVRGVSAAHAVFESWQGPAVVPTDAPMSSSVPAGMLLDGDVVVDAFSAPHLCFMQLPAAIAGGPLHPSAASCMVPVSPSGAVEAQGADHAAIFCGRPGPVSPYIFIPAVSVRSPPPKLSTLRCSSSSLPPLSSAAAAGAPSPHACTLPARNSAGASPSPAVQPDKKSQGDEHADDRCSTGGGVPPGSHGFARPFPQDHRLVDGYDYAAMYGAPSHAYYPCHPHHGCCFRPDRCPLPYPYRALPTPFQMAPECSSGGGAAAGGASSFGPAKPWSRLPTEGGVHTFPQRQPSVESPAQVEPCYPHSWQPTPCGSWSMCGVEGPWSGNPMYAVEAGMCGCPSRHPPPGGRPFCAAGPGCPCGGRADASMYFGRMGVPMMPRGACSMYMHPAAEYASRFGHPMYSAVPEAWKVAPSGREKAEGASGEAEACSSSVSEHAAPSDVPPCNPQEPGRCSPCSGVSGLCQPQKGFRHLPRPQHFVPAAGMAYGHHFPMAFYPPYMCAPRGMVSAGSVTSIPSMAHMSANDSLFAAAAPMHAAAGAGERDALFFGVPKTAGAAADTDVAVAADNDVAPYLNDTPASRCASETVVEDPASSARDATQLAGEPLLARADQGGLGMEGVECALGMEDGFGAAARESLDQDLAFAWENFMACDTGLEGAIPCH